MNWSTISRNVGYALLVDALFMFLSCIIALLDPLDTSFGPLSISFLLTFIVGVFPFIFVNKTSGITLKEGYIIIFLSWLLSFVFGMLPYALWGGPFTVTNAWFESVSGFTTTGATILADVESLPKALLFWRSSTHFIGGLGVVVFLLLIIPNTSQMRLRLTNMELSSLSRGSYRMRSNQTVYVFTIVYLVMNVCAIVLYTIAGMGLFDAVNHAFSVCATGGFSTKNFSIGSFDSVPITVITMVFMLLSSIHFGMVWLSIVNRSLKPFKNEVFAFYIAYLVLFSVIGGFIIKFQGLEATWGRSFLVSSFDMLSYSSTTGLAIADNAPFPFYLSMLMMAGGTICGMAGSTTGGIKSDRMLLLFKTLRAHMRRTLYPNSVTELKFHGKNMTMEGVFPHIHYIVIYGLILLLSMGLTLSAGLDTRTAFTATMSSISNVGPAVGELGMFGNFGQLPNFAKMVYTLDMFMGRVEIYPVLAVFYLVFDRERKL